MEEYCPTYDVEMTYCKDESDSEEASYLCDECGVMHTFSRDLE